MGCDKCYDTFKDTILNLLLRCQISLKHIGKKPKNFKLSDASEIENLNIELQEAIKIEDYEKAACLKEKINLIKNKIWNLIVLLIFVTENVKNFVEITTHWLCVDR